MGTELSSVSPGISQVTNGDDIGAGNTWYLVLDQRRLAISIVELKFLWKNFRKYNIFLLFKIQR